MLNYLSVFTAEYLNPVKSEMLICTEMLGRG